jgi:Domain of unknown function (DUF4091)
MRARLACCFGALFLLRCLGAQVEEPIQTGGRLPDAGTNVVLWWALSSAAKIQPETAPPSEQTGAVQIRCARNERESVQVVVRPGKPLHKMSIEAGSFSGAGKSVIPSKEIEILKAVYLNVTTPTDKSTKAGLWPDPLVAVAGETELEPGINHALWIRVYVPREASSGVYHGVLRMRAEGWQVEVPMELTVYDFALPDQMTCQTALGFSAGEVFRYQGVKDDDSKRQVLEKYWANWSAHHISPYDPAPLDPVKVTWPDVHPPKTNLEQRTTLCAPAETLHPALDFDAWDTAMAKAFDLYHFNSVSVSIPGLGGGTFYELAKPNLLGFGEDSPEYPLLLGSYCREMEAHLRAKGWLDKSYIYWFDEPAESQYPYLQNGFNKLKQYCPGIPRMITKLVEPGLIGGPNLWCPISDQYNHERSQERRKLGERFWWYVCTGPKAPYAGLFLDHAAPEMRIWLWQTFQRNINGILVWQANYWTSDTAYPDAKHPQNPFEDPMSWTSGYGTPAGKKLPWGNGDGRLIYPPPAAAAGNPAGPVLEGPVDSIRWEQLRDGIEDYEYLTILRKRLNQRRNTLKPGTLRDYEKLVEVPDTITRSMTEFTSEGRPIELRRHQIARAIEKL